MNVGIDKISFFVPPYYLDMDDLAEARNVDPNKFHIGLGQDQMAVPPHSQDIITFAANAAQQILSPDDLNAIDMVIVGTESSIDESKASAVVLHRLLNIQPFTRAFEVKEACYAGTAALTIAKNHVALHPDKKVLVVATDIAKYGLNSGGEPTQGAGAVAMLICQNPRILVLESEQVSYTTDIYDFWRPTGHLYPLVDGQLSNETYIAAFQTVFNEMEKRFGRQLADYAALSFHIPYTKMGRKALLSILENQSIEEQQRLITRYDESITYSRRVGNLYTGSLYLGLISLLENSHALKSGDRIGLFSYGSGTVAELFSGILVEDYETSLLQGIHQKILDNRQKLTISEYENWFEEILDSNQIHTFHDELDYSITSIHNTIRSYRIPK